MRTSERRKFCEAARYTVAALPHLDIEPDYDVHVVCPARWLSKQLIRLDIPNQETRHWRAEPELRSGWLLHRVVEPARASVSNERGDMLLLDDGRYMIPSRFSCGVSAPEGLYVPENILQPLTVDTAVDLQLVYKQLDDLA